MHMFLLFFPFWHDFRVKKFTALSEKHINPNGGGRQSIELNNLQQKDKFWGKWISVCLQTAFFEDWNRNI